MAAFVGKYQFGSSFRFAFIALISTFNLFCVCVTGNHVCVAIMNNFVPRSEVDYYTVPHGLEKEPRLPPYLAAPLHNFIMQVRS
jgi:hypothetical protein